MSEIQFNEEQNFSSNQYYSEEKNPFLVQLVINMGLVKDPKSANILLLIMALIFFAVSIYFFIGLSDSPAPPPEESFQDPFMLP